MIKVRDIAYVRYQVPDLNVQAAFLGDFGLTTHRHTDDTLQMATHGGGYPAWIGQRGDNRALGVGFIVDSLDDLDAAAAKFDQPVRPNDELDAGSIVTISDPDGFRIDLLHGGDVIAPRAVRAPLALNATGQRTRRGVTNRIAAGPSHVMRLGHVVLKTRDFPAMMRFYQDVLGFAVSDSYYAQKPDATVAAFLHCGLGRTFTDHHTVALIGLGAQDIDFDHCAFEVIDWDDLANGNRFLAEKGHRHSWGIGRHVQGSQVFDYWRDPFGNKIEHWTDGDLVNEETPVGHEPLSPDALAQWAPPLPADFL
ncbi:MULTISPECIES: VOC family protein [Paraburkholderia]|uniref:Putative 2,3-dihydroxybiphenyl-1,2-dioxygenase or glyoxalase/bleomycin resistance protein n=1 Tax=Paraburkholderia largidicola TaxID=3014751 RepID=A0A7I8BZN6_9BURK|nr:MULTISPECIES: VOC family protein [Paraburkholderia]BAP28581.1 catechol 2,3-dioxygenase [uncultured bacterium]BEU27263.1 VOC family protein [Paraburkholderia sp. 22B1P]GJH36171.1 VOC family protein [Paraburkholderia hospita]CAG9248280.1 Catechol 2,3-dioxygenase [Paraburkholderia caribensis]BCF94093.1 putative 2,3-dihydroxybiphenyl-1,2-dioxygenase or glyoxalase/bleomycin resistance protein [Paraburkholderia sp. PGU16]